MIITSLLCCENIAQDSTTQKLHIINPLQVIELPSIPSNFSISVYLGVLNMDKEGKDAIRIVFYDDDENMINDEATINLPVPNGIDLSKPLGVNINLDFRNLLFSKKGVYCIKVFDLNNGDKEIGKTYFEVI